MNLYRAIAVRDRRLGRVCACDPGSDANGWRETRCAECRAEEIAEWERVVALSRTFDIRRHDQRA